MPATFVPQLKGACTLLTPLCAGCLLPAAAAHGQQVPPNSVWLCVSVPCCLSVCVCAGAPAQVLQRRVRPPCWVQRCPLWLQQQAAASLLPRPTAVLQALLSLRQQQHRAAAGLTVNRRQSSQGCCHHARGRARPLVSLARQQMVPAAVVVVVVAAAGVWRLRCPTSATQ